MVHLSSPFLIVLALFVASPTFGIVLLGSSRVTCDDGYCYRREYSEVEPPHRARLPYSLSTIQRRDSRERSYTRRSMLYRRKAFDIKQDLEPRSPIVILPGQDQEFTYRPPLTVGGHRLLVLRELEAEARDAY